MKTIFADFYYFFKKYELILLTFFAANFSFAATAYYFRKGELLLYGDAESHLNIAKRVIDSLTPGFAQLGGIWLPLPHLLLLPFISSDFLWRTALAGSIVSGIAYIVSAICLYKISFLLLQKRLPALLSFLIFALNPNILYMQATALTELSLLAFTLLSMYFFFKFLKYDENVGALILAGAFGFAASLSRYDGWFLVVFEASTLLLFYLFRPKLRDMMEGNSVLFATTAFFGIILWFVWDWLILGDPFYFTNSPFSAKSQQQGWLARGELPTYKNAFLSVLYYLVTSFHNIGFILAFFAVMGCIIYLFDDKQKLSRFLITIIFFVPFIFYVLTLYMGQSIILIPELTPKSYHWHLFNVRYGIMMVPFAAFFVGYLLHKSPKPIKLFIALVFVAQILSFQKGYERILTIDDGLTGLSASKRPDAEAFMATHYDGGMVLLDDYARTISIIRSNLPMQKVIYIGNKPYWDQSMKAPEKYATWIVVQKDDAVWKNIYAQDVTRGRLFKYFKKVYTSPNVLVFKRNTQVSLASK